MDERKNRTERALKMQTVTAQNVAEVVSECLRKSPYSPSKLAHRTKTDPRAMKNWWSGECAPRAADLINLMAECDDLADRINKMVEARRARK